jgi:hypothetical protein
VKPILFSVLVCALVSPLTAAPTAISYKVHLPNGGDQYYRLEAPTSLPTLKPDPPNDVADPYSTYKAVSEQTAAFLAIAWAGGMSDDKLFRNWSSNACTGSIVNLGTSDPGGFYHASNVRADWVRYANGPVPYYLVHLRGQIGQTTQSFYAAVLPDGRIIRPIPIGVVPRSQNKRNGTRRRRAGT